MSPPDSLRLSRQRLGLLLGPLLCLALLLAPVPEGMSPAGLRVAAVTALMATWWITEAIPIAATALVPIALFPLLGVMPSAKVTPAYANHLIYLFMGGFLLAVCIERWDLHRRIALHTIRLVGTTPSRIVLGFMLATAALSAWISNTATAMMMVTIGMAVLRQLGLADEDRPAGESAFGTSLMLAIAYSASIGGVATLVGTPPNAILAGVLERHYGIAIGFTDWMLFALPVALVMLLVTWVYLTRFAFRCDRLDLPLGREALRADLEGLGPMRAPERRVLAVFLLVVAGWLLRGLVNAAVFEDVADSSIAMLGALLLFLIPAGGGHGGFLLDWKTAARIPWDVILLFGGGFALANGFAESGLTQWLGDRLELLSGAGTVVIVLGTTLLVVFLTEVTSNTATASLLIPVAGGFALAAGIAPLYLMAPVTLAASFAFMLPVATPPNAIVFASRQVSIPQMARAGLWLNLIGTLLIAAATLGLLPWVLGVTATGI